MYVVVTDNLNDSVYQTLEDKGLSYEKVPHIYTQPDSKEGRSHWCNTLSKIYIFKLTQFDKVVYLDLDNLVLKNIDHLFDLDCELGMPVQAIYNLCEYKLKLIANVMVFKPSEELFNSIYNEFKNNILHIPEGFGEEPFLEAHIARHGVYGLPALYNFQMGLFDWIYVKELYQRWGTPYIIHFSSNWKPWMKFEHQKDLDILDQEEFFSVPFSIKKIYRKIWSLI